ncbi:MAG: GNAT family N-acetyltransferase [Desulfobacteraceae bacterium]|nr:MAG: GNAT family N-acetyltransferase [Desulfobacteraceae bacterium]
MIHNLRTITRLDEAETMWRVHIPDETVFDLWEVRAAFHRHYQRPFRFIFGNPRDDRKLFLPLSWVEEKNAWCFFPGETWANKTWLEQNRPTFGGLDPKQLAAELGADFHLRYLKEDPGGSPPLGIDETGYLFHPPKYDYHMDNWWALFSSKKGKYLRRELRELKERGATVRLGSEKDFDLMVEMSFGRFGAASYFADRRFRESFRDLLSFLAKMNLLRVTIVCMNTIPAAVDFGSVYRGRYTLLAGGTDGRFPGVAKLINLFHLEWACSEKLLEADFLCGDFSWKPLFHLTPRPLYLYTSLPRITLQTRHRHFLHFRESLR